MAKTRLNKIKRNRLLDFLEQKIKFEVPGHLQEEIKALKVRAESELLVAYPPQDMDVLERYKAARVLDSVKPSVWKHNWDVDPWILPIPLSGIRIPFNMYSCDIRDIPCLQDIYERFDIINEQNKAAFQEYVERLKPYRKLIETSRTFEDVKEVWEEVGEIENELCSRGMLTTILQADEVAAIRRDMEERQKCA